MNTKETNKDALYAAADTAYISFEAVTHAARKVKDNAQTAAYTARRQAIDTLKNAYTPSEVTHAASLAVHAAACLHAADVLSESLDPILRAALDIVRKARAAADAANV